MLIAVMSTALLSMGALVINWAYIELTHTQLRSATDASAKAAAVMLSSTQNEVDAREAAKDLGREFRIAGKQLLLENSDIEFGNSTQQPDGKYLFQAGVEPLNSARVTGRMGADTSSGGVPVLFANLVSAELFEVEKQSIAGRYDHDICVVVDRSGSMAWDLTGVNFSYPEEYNNDSTLQNYFRAPHPTGSRWAKLEDALEAFKIVVDRRDLNAQIGLVSYASNYNFGFFESTRVTRNQLMSPNTSDFLVAAQLIGQEPIIGDTDIEAGIENGVAVLTGAERRMTANRTMVLLSDGRRTSGGDPVLAATAAADQRVVIFTVSFGDGADMNTLDAIANVTGGTHYHAVTGEQLEAAFEDIAEQLPAILIH